MIRRLRFVFAFMAALIPALLAAWLLSTNSSQSINTLAENAMSQAAHRVDQLAAQPSVRGMGLSAGLQTHRDHRRRLRLRL